MFDFVTADDRFCINKVNCEKKTGLHNIANMRFLHITTMSLVKDSID